MLQGTKKFLSKFIGNKDFYKMILLIAVPIMIQNGITNFVSLLDNIMIGQTGTEQMSGVAIVNQLIFVYNLCLFGGVSCAGIFTAQFYGQGNHEGVRQTMRFKIWMVALITIFTCILLLTSGETLINAYLKGEGSAESINATLSYGMNYLKIILIGLPAFALVQVYSSTMRECGQTLLPMKSGIVAVFVNLILNYLLIYGKFGFPALGVAGAAIATVVSRYVEMLIIVIQVHRKNKEYPYIEGMYKTLKVPRELIRKIIIKGSPLLFNETLWASGMAMLTQCYSIRGYSVVAGLN
ncbi:MAG: polysaccharide biosynthesis C-terminal domain-containing protein, partial [Lachnospiraceae bacterium]|nr:polysaccharide biosynthesis C-terminal domain-containing protein [Lachnospiraceae bacterium]